MGGIRETASFDKTIPILVRRAGPRDEEAFAQLNKIQAEEGYHLFLRGMATSVANCAGWSSIRPRNPGNRISRVETHSLADPPHNHFFCCSQVSPTPSSAMRIMSSSSRKPAACNDHIGC